MRAPYYGFMHKGDTPAAAAASASAAAPAAAPAPDRAPVARGGAAGAQPGRHAGPLKERATLPKHVRFSSPSPKEERATLPKHVRFSSPKQERATRTALSYSSSSASSSAASSLSGGGNTPVICVPAHLAVPASPSLLTRALTTLENTRALLGGARRVFANNVLFTNTPRTEPTSLVSAREDFSSTTTAPSSNRALSCEITPAATTGVIATGLQRSPPTSLVQPASLNIWQHNTPPASPPAQDPAQDPTAGTSPSTTPEWGPKPRDSSARKAKALYVAPRPDVPHSTAGPATATTPPPSGPAYGTRSSKSAVGPRA